MSRLYLLSALILAGAANAQSIEVAGGDWSSIPKIEAKQETLISKNAMDRVQKIVGSKACKLAGQTKNRIDMTVPFLVQFDTSGAPARIVVARMDCPELESVMATVALGLVKSGEYKPTGANNAGWYRSDISFAIR